MFALLPAFFAIATCELGLFTADVNVELVRPSEFTASPNGTYVVYTTKQLNMTAQKRTYRLVVLNVETAESTELSYDYTSAIHDLTWTPDNDVVSWLREDDDTGYTILVLYDITKKTFTDAYNFGMTVENSKWGPNKSVFVFSTLIKANANHTWNFPHENLTVEVDGADAKVFDEGFVYHWGDWEDGTYEHAHYLNVTYNESAEGKFNLTGTAIDLMPGVDGHCPERPYGGSSSFSVSPDDKYIAYAYMDGPAQPYKVNSQVYLYNISANESIQISQGDCRYYHPVFEPGENWTRLIYEGTTVANDESAQVYIFMWAITTPDDEPTIFNPNCPDLLSDFVWHESYPQWIYAKATIRGHSKIVRFNVSNPNQEEYLPFWAVSDQKFTPTHIIMEESRFHRPPDLWYVALPTDDSLPEEGDDIQITFWNDDKLRELYPLVPTEEMEYDCIGLDGNVVDNSTIHAFYLSPLQYYLANISNESSSSSASARSNVIIPTPTSRAPLIMYIHGGPEAGWTDDWSNRWNPQTLTHMGYAVFAPNFHGSDSYSQDFTDSIKGHWGGLPFWDIENGTDYITTYSYRRTEIDPNRIGCMGASYGGYMMNWMNAMTTRYKAIVCHDGLFDLNAFFEETDEVYFYEAEHYQPPWKDAPVDNCDPDNKSTGTGRIWSPSFHINDGGFKTPVLYIHGGVDFRVPQSQGFAAFHTLQGLGTPSRLLYFPDENHWVLNEYNSVRWHQEILTWLKNYV